MVKKKKKVQFKDEVEVYDFEVDEECSEDSDSVLSEVCEQLEASEKAVESANGLVDDSERCRSTECEQRGESKVLSISKGELSGSVPLFGFHFSACEVGNNAHQVAVTNKQDIYPSGAMLPVFDEVPASH